MIRRDSYLPSRKTINHNIHPLSGRLIKAVAFAKRKHAGQKRRETGVSYYLHPLDVVHRLLQEDGITEDDLDIAILHDTLEDTDTTFEELRNEFGFDVADGVRWLTNPSKGHKSSLPRDACKKMDREWIAQAPTHIKRIKAADRICNLRDTLAICEDGSKAIRYAEESRKLFAEALRGVYPAMYQEAMTLIEQIIQKYLPKRAS